MAYPEMDQAAAAKERKKARKMREFKEYLVESGTLEGMVKLLVGVMEADPDHVDAENLLQDFFGHYRDPMWDIVEELWQSNEEEQERRTTLEAQIADLEVEVATEQRNKSIGDLWAALVGGKGIKSMKGTDLLMRLCGLKKPQDKLIPPVELQRAKFIDVVNNYPDEMFEWVQALKPLLLESNDPPCAGERLTEESLGRFFESIAD